MKTKENSKVLEKVKKFLLSKFKALATTTKD